VSGLQPVYNIVHILQLFVGLRPLVFMLFLDYAEVSLFHLVRLVRIMMIVMVTRWILNELRGFAKFRLF